MKYTAISLIAALLSAGTLLPARNISGPDNGRYDISTGEIHMTVDAEHGGMIVSFRYGDNEILSQTRYPNSYGSTFWTSPQSDWSWPPVPEYDSKPFAAEIQGDSLILTGEKSSRFGYRIRKRFTADDEDNSIAVTYTITNESEETRKVAPWEITRVTNGGILFFEADEVIPANNMETIPFTFEKGAAWYVLDGARDYRKVNADGKGWLAFSDYGLLLVKKFQDLDETQPAPGEAEIQVYVNPGKTYVEIEEQGPYTTLRPGEELDWTVRWYLTLQPRPDVPSKSLLNKALKTIR